MKQLEGYCCYFFQGLVRVGLQMFLVLSFSLLGDFFYCFIFTDCYESAWFIIYYYYHLDLILLDHLCPGMYPFLLGCPGFVCLFNVYVCVPCSHLMRQETALELGLPVTGRCVCNVDAEDWTLDCCKRSRSSSPLELSSSQCGLFCAHPFTWKLHDFILL